MSCCRKFFPVLLFLLSAAFISPFLSTGWARDARSDAEMTDMKRIQEENSRAIAEINQNFNTLRQEFQELKGAIEETRHFFEEESQKNGKLLRDYDYRITGLEERMSVYGGQLDDFLKSEKIPASGKGAPVGAGTASGDEGDLYRRALAEINTQNFKGAEGLLDQFLKKFPKSSLADNAQYWKGEALYASRDYAGAILEFQKVVKKYPRSEKAPGAVLKQGYSFYEMKNYPDAKIFLQKVITDYPTSSEAGDAKERILKVDQGPKGLLPETVPQTNPHF